MSPTGANAYDGLLPELSRKRAWLHDELILALDLYMREGKDAPRASRQQLSEFLRAIPVERKLAADAGFRSEKAVHYKLHNFAAIDPSEAAAGFPHVGQRDVEVWGQYGQDVPRLASDAAAIRAKYHRGRDVPPG